MQYPKLVESKTSANEVTTIEWNPGMDLLTTVFINGAMTCSRLLSLQKVWHKQDCGNIASISWRPDGRVLAVGAYMEKTKENVCTLYDVENGKMIYSINKDKRITSVSWFRYYTTEQDKSLLPDKIADNVNRDEAFSHQLAHEQDHLTMLMISTADGKLSFYALGLFYLGDISVHTESSSRIVKTHMSSCLRFVTCVIHSRLTASTNTSSLKIMRIDTLHERNSEILRVAKIYAKITDELEFLDDTIGAMTTSWVDVLAGLDSKLSSYCSRKNCRPDDSSVGYTFLSADELLQLLVIGLTSDNLEKFLTDMSEKGLNKLNNAIEQTCLRVQNLIVKNAQKCCYHIHADLNVLRGMASWRERFSDVGLDDRCIVDAMRCVGSLMLKLTELNQIIDHSLRSTKSFFRWLISIANRMTGEQNNTAIPSDINKMTQQDIQLITDFILDNFDYNSHNEFDLSLSTRQEDDDANRPTCSNFTLEQVGQYLKNESLSRLKYSFMKSDTNFWIEFYKKRPDLYDGKQLDEDGSSVLLLYPHNPETSLMQEHKRACSAISSSFKSVADNIKLNPGHNDNIFYLKDFVRNAPTNRIQVETDLTTMHHYTLFQIKTNRVSRHYLLAQSLSNRSFRLASLEFHALGPTASPTCNRTSTRNSTSESPITIADSSFFEDKDTNRLLLTFLLLDEIQKDTIIVQLELNKFLDTFKIIERPAKDLTKVFRSNDTIDKQASSVMLTLDLKTELASARQHSHDMMVKRIRRTMGKNMFASSGRGVIAFTSSANKRIHLYELESSAAGLDVMDDEVDRDDRKDESLIDAELIS